MLTIFVAERAARLMKRMISVGRRPFETQARAPSGTPTVVMEEVGP